MSIYRVQLCFEGTEDDANSIMQSLAQSVSEEFDLKRVFGVTIDLDTL